MALHRIAAAVGLVGLLTLALPAFAQEITATPGIAPSADFFHLNRVHGDGYSLLVPTGATITGVSSDLFIHGPEIDIKDADGNTYDDDAYSLSIRVYDNPDHLSAEAYATQIVQTQWDKATAENAPTGTLPQLANGQIAAEDSAYLTIAGQSAFEVTYMAADSDDHRIYVAHGDHIFYINYQDMSDYGTPLGQVQLDVYALLLATFQFDH